MARIMVIDDDDAIRTSISKVLERAGHTVVEESNGHSALRHFTGDPTDLVISDVFMPDMDGLQFLIRVREVFPEVRIIVISGGGQIAKDSVLDAASRLGADHVFEKPFEVSELLASVEEVLAR